MPTLADSISMLKIGKKAFQNPEWWSSQHKLKSATKYNEIVTTVAKKANFRNEYRTVTISDQPPVDEYISSTLSRLDLPGSSDYAPWNPMFRKSKTIITFGE